MSREPKAGWEVEGLIDRLTRRDETSDERLVLEAISHLRAFSQDCDALRDDNRGLHAEIERLQATVDACADYGDKQCAEVERLKALIYRNCNSITANEEDAKIIQEIAAALDPKP